MKKTHLLTMALVIICLSVALVSCNKKEDDPAPVPPPVVTKTDLITKAPWLVKTSGFDQNKDGVIDIATPGVKACTLDNTYTFKTDGSGVFDEAASKCDPADPQTSSFTWVFKSEETIVGGDIKFAGWKGDGTISVLNDTSFIFYRDTVIFGISGRAVVSLKH